MHEGTKVRRDGKGRMRVGCVDGCGRGSAGVVVVVFRVIVIAILFTMVFLVSISAPTSAISTSSIFTSFLMTMTAVVHLPARLSTLALDSTSRISAHHVLPFALHYPLRIQDQANQHLR